MAKKRQKKPVKRYFASPGAQMTDDDAQLLGEIIDDVGDVSPHDLVETARPKTSTIHHLFEWDDSVAAQQHRLYQARHHTNHIYVVQKDNQGKNVRSKAFHSVIVSRSADHAERRYVSRDIAVTQEDLGNQVIQSAWAELRRWQERYYQYRYEFRTIFQAIDERQKEVAEEDVA